MKWLATHKLALLGFAVSASYWPGLLSPAVTPRWAVIAVGVPLCSRLDPRALGEAWRWLLVGLLGVALVATVTASPDILGGLLELMQFAMLALVFVAAADFDSVDDVMLGLGCGLALSSVLCAIQIVGWSPVAQISAPAGLFYSREVLAEFAAPLFVWAVLRPQWAVAVVAAVPLLLCGSRVGLIAVAAGVIYAALRGARFALPASVAIICVAVGSIVSLDPAKLATAADRISVWASTIDHWSLLGRGLGWFAASHIQEETAHSDILQAVAELGVAGLLILAVPIAVFFNDRGNHAERAAFLAICVEAAISFPLHVPASAFLAVVLAGFLLGRGGLVRVGQFVRRHEDGGYLQRRNDAEARHALARRSIGRAVSVRSYATPDARRFAEAG